MERVELIEDLDVRGFCAQGTVDAGGFIRTYTAPFRAAACLRTTADGYALGILSSCQ
jgi:hypothetical protein